MAPDKSKKVVTGDIRDYLEPGSSLYTDTAMAYTSVTEYDHKTINHAEKYVDGQVHTNSLENFWSLLKRGLNGTYISVEAFHLFRYLDEQVFRFNTRADDDLGRVMRVLGQARDRHITYAELIGKGAKT